MMKKICLLALWGSMSLLMACTNEGIDAPQVLNQGEGLVSFEAGFQSSDGRTIMEEGGKVKWQAGDEIVLFDESESARYVAIAGGSSTMFVLKDGEKALDSNGTYTAFYPADAYDVSTRTFSVEQVQTAVAGTFDPDAALCMATVTNREYATFSNLCTLMKVNVPQAAIDGGATALNLSAPATIVSGGTLASDGSLNWNKTMKNFRLEGSFEYGKDYYLVIPPQTFEQGFTLAMNNANNSTLQNCARTKSSAVTFEASSSYAMGTVFEVEADVSWYEDVVESSPETTEFELSTPEALVGFMQLLNGSTTGRAISVNLEGVTIKLGVDLDMTFVNDALTPINGFNGTLDGQGHSIKNLKMLSDERYVGLFGYIRENAVIKNLILEGGWVKSNCTLSGDSYVGGIVGYAIGGSVVNCHNKECDVTSTGANYVAGVIGCAATQTEVGLFACSNVANVICDVNRNAHVGGVANSEAGANFTIIACYNMGDVSMNQDVFGGTGGITGLLRGNTQMYGCYHMGSVNGYGWRGSLTGITDSSTRFYYNAYMDMNGLDWCAGWYGQPSYTGLHNASYANVVAKLNVGIDIYNDNADCNLCEYTYVEGNTPLLRWVDVDSSIGTPGLYEGEIF